MYTGATVPGTRFSSTRSTAAGVRLCETPQVAMEIPCADADAAHDTTVIRTHYIAYSTDRVIFAVEARQSNRTRSPELMDGPGNTNGRTRANGSRTRTTFLSMVLADTVKTFHKLKCSGDRNLRSSYSVSFGSTNDPAE